MPLTVVCVRTQTLETRGTEPVRARQAIAQPEHY